MLWNASALHGYAIKATDGLIGTISDLMYRESDWTVRWLVVDTGDWLSGRRVLLPVSALGEPDPESGQWPVNLTMQQIEQSPDIDTSAPLTQGADLVACDHYDLPHGRDHFLWGGHDGKPARPLEAEATTVFAEGAGVGVKASAPEGRVRGLSMISGDSIQATDGHIGHAEDFLIETASWEVRYLVIHTSSWWPGEKVLVSPQTVGWIDKARAIIHLDVSRQKVKDSPPYVAAQTVDAAFEEQFYSYYGIRGPHR